jgi:hypothetical protein
MTIHARHRLQQPGFPECRHHGFEDSGEVIELPPVPLRKHTRDLQPVRRIVLATQRTIQVKRHDRSVGAWRCVSSRALTTVVRLQYERNIAAEMNRVSASPVTLLPVSYSAVDSGYDRAIKTSKTSWWRETLGRHRSRTRHQSRCRCHTSDRLRSVPHRLDLIDPLDDVLR